FTFNLEKSVGAKCDIQVPTLKSVINGANGKVELKGMKSETKDSMFNGKVEIEEDSNRQYKFDLQERNGKVDNFQSSTAEDAIPIQVSIANGRITRDDHDDEED